MTKLLYMYIEYGLVGFSLFSYGMRCHEYSAGRRPAHCTADNTDV